MTSVGLGVATLAIPRLTVHGAPEDSECPVAQQNHPDRHLTRDSETRNTSSGTVTKFTLAVNRRTKDQAQETDYIDIDAWEKLADICNAYLKRGMSCFIEGRLSIRSYETKEGEKRKATEIVANSIEMFDRGGAGATRAANVEPAAAAQTHSADGGTAVMKRTELDESDISNFFPPKS